MHLNNSRLETNKSALWITLDCDGVYVDNKQILWVSESINVAFPSKSKIHFPNHFYMQHFKEGEPSVTFPDPIPADGSDIYKSRRPPLNRILIFENW